MLIASFLLCSQGANIAVRHPPCQLHGSADGRCARCTRCRLSTRAQTCHLLCERWHHCKLYVCAIADVMLSALMTVIGWLCAVQVVWNAEQAIKEAARLRKEFGE